MWQQTLVHETPDDVTTTSFITVCDANFLHAPLTIIQRMHKKKSLIIW